VNVLDAVDDAHPATADLVDHLVAASEHGASFDDRVRSLEPAVRQSHDCT